MPPLYPEQRYPRLWDLPQFGGTLAAKIRPAVADPEGALRQGKRPFPLSFFTGAGNVMERLFPPGLSEPRPVRTLTLIAAGVSARRSDPAETRHSASSAISVHAQYLSGIPVHPKTHLAWTWSVAEANQAIAAGDNAGAQRHESTRPNNAQFILYCSCCPAGPRPPPRH
ncbi:MAG TPA: hypothetical protein VMU57_08255 [Edaphobacter sp.]|uniref:hypothetical protein n=1 Tax=Edaphobacter sp. TaxID=1934404 RepID=UPI002B7AF34D|nr:hypothetical protein [Edaphobacter sp.]HUZ94890.1 hypothetical protein [Edaphobacter sp.]